jgi:4'-phosphopantetheinyl transferase
MAGGIMNEARDGAADGLDAAQRSRPIAPRELPSPAPGVSLWWCELDDAGFEEARGWLSAAEHARAARFGTAALARRYTVGRASLRWVLGKMVDRAPEEVVIERGERGRPRLADGGPDFNLSNTLDVALVGVCALDGVRIGVDLEHAGRKLDHHGLARKFLTSRERHALEGMTPDEHRRAFLRAWTCKEAMSKATGEALGAPLRSLEVTLAPALALAGGPPPYLPGDWQLIGAAVPGDFLGTVALWQHRRSR